MLNLRNSSGFQESGRFAVIRKGRPGIRCSRLRMYENSSPEGIRFIIRKYQEEGITTAERMHETILSCHSTIEDAWEWRAIFGVDMHRVVDLATGRIVS